MAKLPIISGRETVRKFELVGYRVKRQRGSHIRMKHPSNPKCKPLSVPDHAALGKGLLHKLLRDADMTVEEFLKLQ